MRVVAATILIWFLPGFLACGALFPSEDELRSIERLAFSILLSLASTALLGLVLVVLDAFTAIGVWLGFGVSFLLLGSLAYVRRFEVMKVLQAGGKALLSWETILFAAAFAFTIGWFMLWASRTQYALSASAWYYFRQAMEIIRAGTVPATMIEYGAPMYFITNKISFNLISAAFTLVAGLEGAPRVAMYTIWPLIGLSGVVGAWTFLRGRLRPYYAMLTLIGLGWTQLVGSKMSSYRAEAFGIALFFCTLHIIHRAFDEPESLRWAALAGIALGLLGTAHGVPALVCVFWYVSLAASAMLYERAAFFRRVPHMALTTALTGLIVFGTFNLVGSRQVANQEAVFGSESYDLSLASDPTEEWRLLISGFGLQEEDGANASPAVAETLDNPFWGRFYTSPAEIVEYEVGAITHPLNQSTAIQFLIIFILWWVIFTGRRKTDYFSPALAFLVVILLSWALFFSYYYDTFLPATHPLGREMPYLQLVGVLILGTSIDQLDRFMVSLIVPGEDVPPDREPDGKALNENINKMLKLIFGNGHVGQTARALALVPLIGLIWIGSFGSARFQQLHRNYTLEWTLSDSATEALIWLAENTPEGSVIATNVRTTGQFNLLAKRNSLAEGRAPYLQPENLARSLSVLVDLYEFFEDPRNEVDNLERLDPDYVVFVRQDEIFGARFAGRGTGIRELRERLMLEERVRFGEEDEIVIYEVVSDG